MNATVNNSIVPYSNNRTNNFAEPLASSYVRVFVFAFIMLGSVLGNAVVCKAILSLPTRQLLFSYYLVTNLAFAEIISSLCFPFYFVYDWVDHWPFGDVACKLVFPIQMTAMFVVTYTLAFIAAYRYRVIVFSCHHLVSRSLARVLLVLGLLWVAALIIVLPAAVVMHNKTSGPSGESLCISQFPGDTSQDTSRHIKYSFVRFIVSFVVPYLIISISYIAVALKINKHVAKSNATRKNDATGEDLLPQNENPQFIELEQMGRNTCMRKENGKKTKTKRLTGIAGCLRQAFPPAQRVRARDDCSSVMDFELDILRMIYLIILTFIVCYIPIQVVFLYEQVNGGVPPDWPYYLIVRRYAFLLTCLPGAFHPILYGTMSKFYAKAFATLVSCHTK